MQEFTGYIEGYYGKLLNWRDRDRIICSLANLGMNSYLYAPKEDSCHRQFWRKPYEEDWRQAFAAFTSNAAARDIQVIAGIAPGLDFNFASLDQDRVESNDFILLLEKARQFLADGATLIALLMDDIAPDFNLRAGDFTSEGEAHGALTNKLGVALENSLILVPRIYADCLISKDDAHSVTYLSDLVGTLDNYHRIMYCGDSVVAATPSLDKGGCLSPATSIIWDNFYANDYCPRRLFLGPRRATIGYNIMFNPTGMIETDLLLLDIILYSREMANNKLSEHDAIVSETNWRSLMTKKGVPEAFFHIAYYFDVPEGFSHNFAKPKLVDTLSALENLLWRWKSPLQREWYPYLMGLKQDILIANGQQPLERIRKTQLQPLASQFEESGLRL